MDYGRGLPIIFQTPKAQSNAIYEKGFLIYQSNPWYKKRNNNILVENSNVLCAIL